MRFSASYFIAIKFFISTALIILPTTAHPDRIKDLINVQGVRTNQVMGYGLVVGLDGTGDQSSTTSIANNSVLNMLQQLGLNMPLANSQNYRLRNVAAVMVTGILEPFAQPGQLFDVTAASIGTAKSLKGGTLLMTALKGADGQIYAMAQGNITSTQSLQATSGHLANTVKTPMIINNGATVERSVASELSNDNEMVLELKNNDFTTAGRIVDAINMHFRSPIALAKNSKVIKLKPPLNLSDQVAFLGEIETLEVRVETSTPKVVLNEKTGSIVINQKVILDACAVTIGNISVIVSADPIQVKSIPPPKGKLTVVQPGVLLIDVVNALNGIGATPQDLIVILQSMKTAGALHAEIEII